MKISLRWLNDFVNVADFLHKPSELAEILTRAGLEVENIVNRGKDFELVVTGHILSKEKHPNADKLSLCQVTTQAGVVHQIVCGAQNHKSGDKVVVALPGAVLPGNFQIKKAVVRGIESGGMLCSEKELGLATQSEGILILPENAPIGKSFAEYQGFDDVTFELKVTPNRADCLSHFGLAREVACLLSKPLCVPVQNLQLSEQSTQEKIQVEIRNSELCPRYAGRYFSGVKIGPSPDWLRKRLEIVGLQSINNVVDVTNYVMHELGQPLHAFDADQLVGAKVIVDLAKKGQHFTTLDGRQLLLNGEELVISDGQGPVALAGVMGGKNSGVSGTTTNVFLESAFFQPTIVRRASKAHGIVSDSAYRFSRGVDSEATLKALHRATELILQCAGGVATSDYYDQYTNPVRKNPIQIKIQTISDRLGYVADGKIFMDSMQRLSCQVEKKNEEEFQVLPPTFRFDLENEMDLVEEYARLRGYEHIPESLPMFQQEPKAQDALFVMNNRMSQSLRGQGYQQAMNFAFVDDNAETVFIQNTTLLQNSGLNISEKKIRLLNPLSEDLNVMRSTLCFGLMRNMVYNFHQNNLVGRLFELGRTFALSEHYQETNRLALMAWGKPDDLWTQQQHFPLIFEVKAHLEALLHDLRITSYQWQAYADKGKIPGFLHQGRALLLVNEGKNIGFVGALHPSLVEENKIRTEVVIAELEIESLLRGQPRIEKFKALSKFPVIFRDLALVMSKSLKSAEVTKEIQKQGGSLLQSVEVFDFYEGEKLEKGFKSIAYRLKFQEQNATLQDETVNKIIETILAGLKEKMSISVR